MSVNVSFKIRKVDHVSSEFWIVTLAITEPGKMDKSARICGQRAADLRFCNWQAHAERGSAEMRVQVSFEVDADTRKAIARELDGKEWKGRLATRSEIAGKIRDGAEDSLVSVTCYYESDIREAERQSEGAQK